MKDASILDHCIKVDTMNEVVPTHESLVDDDSTADCGGITCAVGIAFPAVAQSGDGWKLNSDGFGHDNAHD